MLSLKSNHKNWHARFTSLLCGASRAQRSSRSSLRSPLVKGTSEDRSNNVCVRGLTLEVLSSSGVPTPKRNSISLPEFLTLCEGGQLERQMLINAQKNDYQVDFHNRRRCLCNSYIDWWRGLFPRLGRKPIAVKNNVGHLALSHNISECNIDERKQKVAELD